MSAPDRDATCDWNCVLEYPHTGPCSSSPALTPFRQKVIEAAKEEDGKGQR